ncbi:hypothetical protein K1X84_16635 [bacterium]|nr:hypothetical protein [bacterium]
MKNFLLLLLLLLAGCGHNVYVHDDKELNETEKTVRTGEIEALLKTLKPGDAIIVYLYDGTQLSGQFYSLTESAVTLQIGSFFRDTDLQKIRGIYYKSDSKNMKPLMFAMIGVMMAYIIYEFSLSTN